MHNAMHISVSASAICSYFVGNSYVAPQKQLMLTAMRYTEDKLLEKLVEVEQWAMANLDVLRLRDGDCFKAKLRQLNGGEEKRIHNFLTKHQKRLEASAALAAQLAKLGCMVMAPGDTGLHSRAIGSFRKPQSAKPHRRRVERPGGRQEANKDRGERADELCRQER